jgi:hypothetical protein
MRRRDNHVGYGKSFDSFLSIVTKNGLGMLILVAMASTFTSEQVLSEPRFQRQPETPVAKMAPAQEKQAPKGPRPKLFLGTPLLKKAPAGAKFVEFECRAGRVFPADIAVISQAYDVFFREADNGADLDKLAQRLNAQKFANEWYTFEFKARCGEPNFPQEPAIYCMPRSKTQGESLDELKKPDSLFLKKLQAFDKDKVVVSLRVWPDSFEMFRDLRQWLHSEGHAIRWDPVDRPKLLLHPRWYGGTLEIDG